MLVYRVQNRLVSHGISQLALKVCLVSSFDKQDLSHGVLFVAYCFWVLIVGMEKKWSFTVIFLALAASLLPFATFVADAKLFRKS